TSGLWVNGFTDSSNLSGLAWLDGGSVTFDSTQGATLAAGSTVDVSSGGAILPNAKTEGGAGGSITLTVDHPTPSGIIVTAPLLFASTVHAIGVTGGGKLSIVGNSILIAPTGTKTTAKDEILLAPDVFADGFSDYDIRG